MKKPTILIVDDDRNVRTALRVRLLALGYHVLEGADRLGALQECTKGTADTIILDHQMPDGDRRWVARMVRNESDVPAVTPSGRDRREFRTMATKLPDGVRMSQLLASIIEPPRVTDAVA